MLRSPRHAPRRRTASRTVLAPVAALAITAVLAGCGGSSPSKPKTAAAPGYSQFLSYSRCMRAHGVPNFPDPSTGGGGIHVTLSAGGGSGGGGLDPSSPSFRAAQTTCQHLLPGGGPGKQKPSAQVLHQMLEVSECMRAHGVTGFPDPTTGSPPADMSNYSLAEARGGVVLAVPKSINVNSPVFERAATACQFGGPGGSAGRATPTG